MSVQNIRTDQDDLFLIYLDNGEDSRLFPPMRIEEDANFVKIWGSDNKLISISKVGFEVIVNGTTYNDVEDAIAQISVEIGKVVTRYAGSGGGGTGNVNIVGNNAGLNEEATQLLVLGEAQDLNEKLEAPQVLTFIDLTVSGGSPWPGFPMTITQIDWNDGTISTGGAITPTVVNNTTELATLFNATIAENQMQARDATSVYLLPATNPVPTAGGAFVNIQTNVPEVLFYSQGFWATEPEQNPSSPKIAAEKLSNIVDGVDTTPTITPLATYPGGGAINTVVQIVAANPNRKKISISVTGGDAWIIKAGPGGSVRRGILVKNGGTWFDSVGNDGAMYRGTICAINTGLNLEFDYSVTEE